MISSIILSLVICLNSKRKSISFSFFERQLFQRVGPLTDIANRVVLRNIGRPENFIKEKLVG